MANKSFPQFTKTIVQLPIPSSTLTKAEYKAKYGIDLNAIDFPKIIVLVDGKDKYPVDEVRVVGTTTEIYAGGKILSIGSSNVSVTSDAYSVANAKPIYFHPILINKTTGTLQYRVSFIILNNDATAFTFNTFKTFIDNLYESVGDVVRFPCSGFINNGTKKLILACFAKYLASSYIFVGGDDNFGASQILGIWNDLFETPDEFTDGVNKIN